MIVLLLTNNLRLFLNCKDLKNILFKNYLKITIHVFTFINRKMIKIRHELTKKINVFSSKNVVLYEK